MFRQDLLRGKTVLITGGAGGLGSAMTERFASLGARVIMAGRSEERLRAALTGPALAPYRDAVSALALDVRSPESVERAFDAICSAGPLHVLVNNAAANFIARSEKLSPRAAQAILDPSLNGALYCSLQAGRRWIDAGQSGVILNILSTSALTGRAFTVPSAMAKAAVLAMTRSLAVEWGSHGIRNVAIAPGPFPTTGATAQLRPDSGSFDSLVARIPAGRVGKPAELADLAAFLVSDGAGYINGEMVAIDGGSHLRTSGAEDLLEWSPARWDSLEKSRR